MLDFPLMLWVKLPVVDRIQPQSNKFATGDPSAFSKTWLPAGTLLQVAGCIPAFSTRGKGALGPLLSALAGARKRVTPTSNLTESNAGVELNKATGDSKLNDSPGRFLLNASSVTCTVPLKCKLTVSTRNLILDP